MIDSEERFEILKISNINDYRQAFHKNYELFNLSKREAEIFFILFEFYKSDNKSKYDHFHIYNKLPENRKNQISPIHIRNILNILVKKQFINYEIERRHQARNYNYEIETLTDDVLENFITELDKNAKLEVNYKNNLLGKIRDLQLIIKRGNIRKNKGKKPRLYFYDENLMSKKREALEEELIDSLTSFKYGFKISSDDVLDLIEIKDFYYLDSLKIQDLDLERFLNIYLNKDEKKVMMNIDSISTISILQKNMKISTQKIRKLLKELVKKRLLKEINPNIEIEFLKNLSETTDLLKTLKKNEKIYQLLPIELAIKNYLNKIIKKFFLKQKIIDFFLKNTEDNEIDLDYNTYEILPISYTEIFQSLKHSFKSIIKLETEFEETKEEIKTYKSWFEEVDYGLIYFEDNLLKYFDFKAQSIFNLRESEKNELKYTDFLFNRSIEYEGKGKANVKKYVIDDPHSKNEWTVNIKQAGIGHKMTIYKNFRRKHKIFIIIKNLS